MHRLTLLLALVTCSISKPQSNTYSERPNPGPLQAYVKFSPSDLRNLKTRGYALPLATASPLPTGFKSTVSPLYDTNVASTQMRKPIYEGENYPIPNALPGHGRLQPVLRRPPAGAPQQFRQQLEEDPKELPLEEEEKEEPDRLSLLLPNSKFDCAGKVTGYYADEGLNCEVFHYCQDNVKHSWICPDGFTFHQVHLICMPPSHENICDKSSQFHFVNDYLYKPINAEEVQTKPNVTLRYSDRYYPDSYYESEEEEVIQQPVTRKQPIQVGLTKTYQQPPQVIAVTRPRPVQQTQFTPTFRPETQLFRGQHGQVFHSPEEVNIPLQQRKPFILAQRPFQQPNRDQDIEYE